MSSTVQLAQRHKSPQTARPFPLTVIVLTHNEANNIEACIEQLEWADDVVLVDSHSSDDTIELAQRARPDVRVFAHRFQDFGDQRNWALDHTHPRHQWILFLDADERCTPELANRIQEAIDSDTDKVGFYLTCRNYFLGRWIRRCTLYPSWQLRLLRLGEVRYRKEGHGQREVTDGPLGYLREPYDHFGFSKGIAHWIERHNAYSTNECELIQRLRNERLRLRDLLTRDPIVRRRCLKRMAARVPGRAFNRFLLLYVLRGGFLDGYPGLIFCLLRSAHEIHIMAKRAEAKHDEGTRKSALGNGSTEPRLAERSARGVRKPR